MANDPTPVSLDAGGSTVMVDADELAALMVETLVANGAAATDARLQSDVLLEAELRDHPSHGVRRLPILVRRLRAGLVRSGVTPTKLWQTSAWLDIDGERAFGPCAAAVALDAICGRAEETGIAVAAVHNANHVGMLAPYLEQIADRGQIGIALTTSEALVHPWGGATAMVGTNPLGIAVPTSAEPVVLDMATSAVSMGRILGHVERGAPIPAGWAVDPDGEPTTDARAAAAGALSPFGGPKGYALGLTLEVLVATLTGTALGTDVRGTLDSEHPSTKGDLFVAISPRRLQLPDHSPAIAAYLDAVRGSAEHLGREVLVPGDRARATRRWRLAHGIPVLADTLSEIRSMMETTSGS